MSRVGFPAIGMIVLLLFTACGDGSSGTPLPIVTMSISPSSIPAGQSATLTWSSANSSTCAASGAWTGSQPTSGSLGVSPAAPGTFTYTLSCSASGSAAATAAATLTVTPPPLAITTPALANGVVGTSYNESIQATGGVAPFVWTVSSGALPHSLSLGPSTTNVVTISGTPDTVAQAVAVTIQVTDSAHNTATQLFTVSILLQADSLVLSPPSLDFGNQIVGSPSGALTETLTNTASSAMIISSVAVDTNQASNTGEFTQSSTTCGSSLAAGASCAINVTFTPGQTGPRGAALTITDDTAGSPQSVGLGGVGLHTGPDATLSVVTLPFFTELVGTTGPAHTLSLTNYGTAALNIGGISATASFAEKDTCVPSLAAGAACTISVTFTPGGSGDVTGTLSISDDAAGAPQNVTLSGTGSANTPLLNGYCLTTCGLATDTAQCPVGQQSKNPVSGSTGRVCGVGPEGGFVVLDEARICDALIRGHRFQGLCEAGGP